MITSFQDIFKKTANRFHIGRQLDASLICTYARDYLKQHFTETDQVNVISFKLSKLTLSTPDAISAQKLTSHKLDLIDLINEKCGTPTVQKILIKITNIPYQQEVNETMQ